MTAQDTYATFCEKYKDRSGKVALRDLDGIIHAYPMRGLSTARVKVSIGLPMCGEDAARFMAARAVPTADSPTCEACLAAMRKALGRG